jgi:hypothetical protein
MPLPSLSKVGIQIRDNIVENGEDAEEILKWVARQRGEPN